MSDASSTLPAGDASEQPAISKRLRDFILGTSLVGFIARGTLIPLLFFLLIFLFAFWRAWVDPDGSAVYFAYIRSLFEMIVSIAVILIIIATGVLIIQIARFINLLRSEIKPITEDTKQAIKNVRATTGFVQQNAVKPIISVHSFVAGLIAFLREISHISRILQRRAEEADANSDL